MYEHDSRYLNCQPMIVGHWAIRTGPCGEIETLNLQTFQPGPRFISPKGGVLKVCGGDPAGKWLIVSTYDDQVTSSWVFDFNSGNMIRSLPDATRFPVVAPNGQRIATVELDAAGIEQFVLYETETFSALPQRTMDHSHSSYFFFSPDSRMLIQNGGQRHEVQIAHLDGRTSNTTIKYGEYPLVQMDVSPDGQWVALVGPDQSVRVFHTYRGHLVRKFNGHNTYICACRFHPNGRLLYTGASDACVVAWDLTAERPEGHSLNPYLDCYGSSEAFGTMTMTADGKLRILHSEYGIVDYLPGSGNLSARHRIPHGFFRDAKELHDCQFDAKGRYAVAVMRSATPHGNRIALLDGETGQIHAELDPAPGRIWVAGIAADGSQVIAATIEKIPNTKRLRGRVFVWDVATRKIVHTLEYDRRVTAVAFHPDGRRVALSILDDTNEANHRIVEVELSTKKVTDFTHSLEPVYATHLHYNAKGDRLGIISPSTASKVILFDTATHRELWNTEAPGMLTSLAFSPDGHRLASTGYRDITTFWDMETGAVVYMLRGATGRTLDFAFPARIVYSPCGNFVAANHWNKLLTIWAVRPSSLLETHNSSQAARQEMDDRSFRYHLIEYRDAKCGNLPTVARFHEKALESLKPPTAALHEEYLWQKLRMLRP
jgi:WD40 repeat protein